MSKRIEELKGEFKKREIIILAPTNTPTVTPESSSEEITPPVSLEGSCESLKAHPNEEKIIQTQMRILQKFPEKEIQATYGEKKLPLPNMWKKPPEITPSKTELPELEKKDESRSPTEPTPNSFKK